MKDLLGQNLEEEKEADEKLTGIAGQINPEADVRRARRQSRKKTKGRWRWPARNRNGSSGSVQRHRAVESADAPVGCADCAISVRRASRTCAEADLRSTVSSCSVGDGRLAERGREANGPTGRFLHHCARDARVKFGHDELVRVWLGLENSEVRDDGHRSLARQVETLARIPACKVASRGDEVHLLDKRTLRLLDDDHDLARERCDFWRAAGAGQPHGRPIVRPDYRGVDVAEAIDLRGAEKSDVDPPALEPVSEDFGRRDDSVGGISQLAVADRQWQHARPGADRARIRRSERRLARE